VSDPRRSVASTRWAFTVNTLAASPYIGSARRAELLRRGGIDVRTHHIEPRCYFHSSDILIGTDAYLNFGVHVENVARVEIGDRTGIGMLSAIATSDHAMGGPEERIGTWTPRPVTIGSGCWIGARVLVLPGVTIGDGCVVAAGAVVADDLEPNGLYAGVPARRVRDL
jgi:maltose O-acetyltransferase